MFSSTVKPARLAIAIAIAAVGMGAPLMSHAQSAGKSRVIVHYNAGSAKAVLAAVAKLGGRVEVDLSEVNAVAITLPKAKVAALKSQRGVESVENDAMQSILGARTAVRAKTNAVTSTQVVPYGIPMVQADQLPALSGPGKTVCIVDSGINATHEDLAANTMSGKNYVGVGDWSTDENSHGTHVAGTVAAVNNSVGVVGVAPNQELKLFISKVFDAAGSSASSLIAKGMLGCLGGRSNVISMSLGGSGSSPLQQKVSTFLAGRNVLLIAAAGNGGSSAVSYPAGYAEVMSVAAIDESMVKASFSQFNSDVEIAGPGVATLSSVPAGSQLGATATINSVAYSVIPVGDSPLASATGPLANFGFGGSATPGSMTSSVCLISRGDGVTFADKALNCQASGGVGAVIFNNVPEPINPGLQGAAVTIPVVFATQDDGALMLGQLGTSATVAVAASDAQYAAYSGTSMATPHVSAVAALVWSHFPSCTAAQMRSHINATAMDLGDPGRDVNYGYGLIRAKALYDSISALGCAGAPMRENSNAN